MAKYSRRYAGGHIYDGAIAPEPVIVLPEADWRRLVELVSGWFPTHSCGDGDCQDCREDAELKAIIEKVEAANG